MSVADSAVPLAQGPSDAQRKGLRRVALLTVGGLFVAAVTGAVSTMTIAPAVYSFGRWGGTIAILATFFFAHRFCRTMVYGDHKIAGFVLAAMAEGISFGFLLLTTLAWAPEGQIGSAFALLGQALFLTVATAFGMLVYVWFNRSDFSVIRAGLAMAGIPMLVLMGLTVFFPIGGTMGLIISALFVLFSAGGLLYRLNYVVHELTEEQSVEGAYEITMGLLVLLWNIITLLNRRR